VPHHALSPLMALAVSKSSPVFIVVMLVMLVLIALIGIFKGRR